MQANYHTHTRWCHHATGEIEDYIIEAMRLGFEELAITEHVPHRDNLDPKRIQWEDFQAYDTALNSAIEKYGDKIHIIKGFECEYYPEEMESYQMFRDKYGYELMILGQHRCGPHREIDNFGTKGAGELMIYASEVTRGLKTGFFDFLAHPDLPLQGYIGGAWDVHCELAMRKIYSVCEEYHIPIEINGNGLRGGKVYPSREAFRLSKEYNLQYLVNSDAHHAEFLYDDVIRSAEQFAEELGLPVLKTYEYRRK